MDAFPTALGLALLIRSKEASPLEVLEETLDRVERLNPALNAVVWRDDDAARAEARRMGDVVARAREGALPPFYGVPIPIKDLTFAAGQPNTLGSWGGSDAVSTEDELVVAAFRRAGFLVTGRTNTPELGPITAAENARYGITRNPWDTERTPGGSSGGAAAAVASGMFAVAHGNDGGGSIRIPASCCGLVGLKVSRGRVPSVEESWEGASVEGVLTHTVADTAAVLDVIGTYDPRCWYSAPPPRLPYTEEASADPPRLRVGLVEAAPLGIPVSATCVDAVHAAAKLLESLGHAVVPATIDVAYEELAPFLALIDASYTQPVSDWSKTSPHIRAGRARGEARSSVEYVAAIKALQRWSRGFVSRWGTEFDVLISPTMTIEPPPAGQVLGEVRANPDHASPTVFAMAALTSAFNISGLPAISLPLHQAPSGLPVGVQFAGGPFDE
ncbi:MAG TPA: amidase, partial [Acidimicrobiales bacterium]|nr:amidase [Acidimicrobiales bacterium]